MMHKPFLFFGTPGVAAITLDALLAAGYRPEAVITSPDAPQGRGMTLTPSETKTYAVEKGLSVLSPERIDSTVIEHLRTYNASYAIVVAYGKLLPQELIELFPLGVLNVHYSLLPKYRGAAPVEGALLAGESVTGVSIQQMVLALDAGDVLASRELSIEPEETARELRPRLIALGSELLVETLPAFEEGTIAATPQDESAVSFSRKIPKEARALSLSNPEEAWNKYRAYAEAPGTHFFMERERTRIRVKVVSASPKNGFTPLRVVPEGKKETDYTNLLSSGWQPV